MVSKKASKVIKLNASEITFKPLITKEIILSKFTSLELFKLYIPELVVNKPMLSPLRDEKNASFSIFESNNNGNFLFKDHATGVCGDIFKFLTEKFPITYHQALGKVCLDLGLNDNYRCGLINKEIVELKSVEEIENLKKVNIPFIKKVKKIITIRERNWEIHDIKFWSEFGIKLSTLNTYNVVPLLSFYINDNIILADRYSYAFKENKDNETTFKIYQPYNIHGYKWRTTQNKSVWHGWTQLPEYAEIVVLTKSLKDVMAIVDNTPFAAVSMQSETVVPKAEVLQELSDRFNTVVLLYDNDYGKLTNVGQKQAQKILTSFPDMSNLVNVRIPDKFQSKDFSDFIKDWTNIWATKELIKMINHKKCPF